MAKGAILCVDDEKIIVDSVKQQLWNNFGNLFIYESALNAEEALEIIDELIDSQLKILIIVSDWLMPGIKGDDFLVRVHKKHPEIITVMLTGQADVESIKRAEREANLFRCLSKPWREEDLIETILLGMKEYEKPNDIG